MYIICIMWIFLSFLSLLSLAAAGCADPDYNKDPDPMNIERPCPGLDVDCIRQYFWVNSECSTVNGEIPDSLFLKHYVLELPTVNFTADVNNVKFEGLSLGQVVEFYINHVTKKLVLAIELPCVKSYSPEVTVSFNKKAAEPTVRTDTIFFDYGTLTLTAVFPNFNYIQLNQARVSTYVEGSSPKFELGPRFTENLDPAAQVAYDKFFASIPEALREIFVPQGYLLMINYIQSNICNFGL